MESRRSFVGTLLAGALALLTGCSARRKRRLLGVGIDSDGSIRPVEELSYAPESGWKPGTMILIHKRIDPQPHLAFIYEIISCKQNIREFNRGYRRKTGCWPWHHVDGESVSYCCDKSNEAAMAHIEQHVRSKIKEALAEHVFTAEASFRDDIRRPSGTTGPRFVTYKLL